MKKIAMDRNWKYVESELKNKLLMNMESNWKETDIPHDYGLEKARSKESMTGANEGYTSAAALYYKKEFKVDEAAKGKRFILEFEGITGVTTIWFNGEYITKHLNPFTGIIVDVTKYIKFGQENQIMVVTDNRAKPSCRWYTGTGIYRHVWMHIGEPVAVIPHGIRAATRSVEGGDAIIEVSADIENRSGLACETEIMYEVVDSDGRVAASARSTLTIGTEDKSTIKDTIQLPVPDAILWDTDNPYLYTMRVTVLTNEGRDCTEQKFGIRTILMDSKAGFRLNGKAMKLQGGCIHADLGILGSASHDAAERRKIRLLKEFGFHAVRLAHNPYAPGILEACDELGMLVIAEAFDEWVLGRTSFGQYTVFEYEWENDLENMIRRDYNHPCIIMWSTGNEVEEREGAADGFAWSRRLAKKVKSLDSYRPTTVTACSLFSEYMNQPKKNEGVTGNQALNMATDQFASGVDVWGDTTEAFFAPVDIAGYNYKTVRYAFDREKYPDRVIYGSETYPLFAFESWQATLENPNVIGDFVWTAMDYIGEIGIGRYAIGVDGMPPNAEWPWLNAWCGDIDFIGEIRPQGAYRRALWNETEEPYIAVLPPEYYGKTVARLKWTWDPVAPNFTFDGQEGKMTEVQVYCHADEIELFHNDISLGRKAIGLKEEYRASYEILYQPGNLRAVAYKQGVICGENRLCTVEKLEKLVLMPDREEYISDGKDLAFIMIHGTDKQGNKASASYEPVHLEIEGEAVLVAFGNADPKPDETRLFHRDTWNLYEGSALAVLRSTGKSGSCKITASTANGLCEELSIHFAESGEEESKLIHEIAFGVLDIPLSELLKDEKASAVLHNYLSEMIENPAMDRAKAMPLRKLNALSGGTMFPAELLAAIEQELQSIGIV